MRVAFGRRLKALRIAAGYRVQRRFVEALGHSSSSRLSQWESGEREPNMHDIGQICQLTGGSVDWLYFGNPALMPYGLMREIQALSESGQLDTE